MPDIIHLLPDSVANQIAAGEVIQRPASAVKELLENAIDAGSTDIQLIVKDSGKTLIQVMDNGCGMSETDARMCFERHATSKIRKAEDLFSIRTMGFRGEALPSVAAVAQVEMKTRRHDDDIGTSIVIEGAEVKSQNAVTTSAGTSISVKNLFFNIPARRNFLKSNPVEARHIIEEFERVALTHPEISISLNQNGLDIFRLPVSNLRQRIVNIFGSNYNERLVPVEEQTSLLSIGGFVGKPQFSRKTRGEQFLYVNKRFIKDAYLHHAVTNAFEELLPHDAYPSYWLYIDIDPARIDVNIHPTKTEVKFEDERSIYAIVRAAIKRALGQYSVAPALDFERETGFDIPHAMRNQPAQNPSVTINPEYNPFKIQGAPKPEGWKKVYEGLKVDVDVLLQKSSEISDSPDNLLLVDEIKTEQHENIFQLHQRYIVAQTKVGLMLIDQKAAHERILYDRYLRQINERAGTTQQELFPVTISLSAGDYEIIKELEEDIRFLGFDLREFGANTYVIHGTPAEINKGDEKKMIEQLIEHFKNSRQQLNIGNRENLLRAMARSASISPELKLSSSTMKRLVEELLACEKPYLSIEGKTAVVILGMNELNEMFRK